MKRNAPCPCGSGKKFKHCCLVKPRLQADAWRRRSDEDVAYLAKLQGLSVTELKESWREKFEAARARARARRIRNPAMLHAFLKG